MKTTLIYLLLLPALLISCQKELSLENGAGTNSATFTFDGSPSACTLPTINGTYMAGLALSANNTISLSVSVTKVGSYSVTTTANNGIKFSGSGTFTAVGNQNITLTGSGTPGAAGSYTFTPGTAGCSFTVTVTAAAPPATFTYNSTSGACSAPSINGSYAAGAALNSSNTIVLGVNVTVAGSYSINTNSANGVTFSGSGVLSLGNQSITLTSTNTPASAGTFSYIPTGGCSFPVVYTAASGGGGGGGGSTPTSKYYFQFNDGATLISADTASVTALSLSLNGIVDLSIEAFSITGDTAFAVGVAATGGAQTGVTYNTSNIGVPLTTFSVVTPTGTAALYNADVTTFGKNIAVKFTLIDVTNKIVSGTFSGTALTASGGNATITNGKFCAALQ